MVGLSQNNIQNIKGLQSFYLGNFLGPSSMSPSVCLFMPNTKARARVILQITLLKKLFHMTRFIDPNFS